MRGTLRQPGENRQCFADRWGLQEAQADKAALPTLYIRDICGSDDRAMEALEGPRRRPGL